MASSDGVGLQLRLGGHGVPECPPDLAAFASCRHDASLPEPRPHDIAVMPGATSLQPRAPLVVFFQHAAYAIPRPRLLGDDAPTLLLDSWRMRPTAFGYLASVPRERNARGRVRAAWVLAACLPLVPLAEAAAAAAPNTSVQRPKRAPTSSQDEPSTTAEPTTAEPTTEAPPAIPYGAGVPSEPSAAPITDTDVVDAPVPPPTPTDRSLGSADPAIVDAAWEGVDGFDVVLELKGAGKLEGRIGAVQRDTFTLIQAGTGAVLVLAKSGVQSVRARMPGPLPSRTGGGLLAGGIVMTSVATPVFLTGLVFLGICPSCTYIHLPMLLVGGAVLGGGIPMIVVGAKRRRAYLDAVREHSFSPVVMRTPGGWTGGVRFRF
ncbi:MAG: hypothetical protein IAG13_17175 [Deltaproteobacteria bacterium]|nr:hypothetical protein [Nannocystaceae bacterium]